MKIQVKLNSTYKWAIIDETYLVDMPEEEILDYFGANSIEDISTNELGSLALNGYGERISHEIIELKNCKNDSITEVEVLQ